MIAMTAVAAPRTQTQMKRAAAKAINELRAQKRMAPKQASELKTLKTLKTCEIIGLEQVGFAVIAKDDVAPEVLGVSTANYSEGKNTNFQWWLEAMDEVVTGAAGSGIQLTPIAPDPSKYPTMLPPLMTSHWDQLEPYNRLCPTAKGGGKCYTGCVATAMAQVLNYHQTPEHGYGQRTIYYPYQNTTGEAVTADFENTYYDWDNMLDNYTAGNYNDQQALAVATLMRDCAVACDMMYGGYQEGGSGAYSQDAATGLQTYFGLMDAKCLERDNYYNGAKNYSDAEWMDIVFSELNENGPLYYGGADSYQGGHAFVLHGYDATGKVYVNWGWSGDDDGYYDISLLNPSGYQFSRGQDMIVGVKGAPRNLLAEELTLAEAGKLSTVLADTMIGKLGQLKLAGDINSSDLLFLRKLAGVDERGEKTGGYLNALDLSEARFVAGGNAYLIDGSKQLTTADDELPSRAFYDCRQLKSLVLPAGLKSWGDGAIALCPLLSNVEIGTPAQDADFIIDGTTIWNLDKTEIIEVLPSATGDLNIEKGVTALHDYAAAGCARLTKVVIPNTVATIGREAFRMGASLQEIRVVNKDVPTLTGANVFTDVNVWSCKLYVPSGSKGKYAQKAQWSDFKGGDYDNIVEFGSSVKVRNTIRPYGSENPTLTYVVQGDPIEGEPVLTCEATPESPAGRYTISISAGTITDEMVDLIDGYLVVQKAPAKGIIGSATREEGEPNPEFTLTIEGLVLGETEPTWLTEPVLTCEADENSPAGEYPITVVGGKAENYDIDYVPGVLTVKRSPTAIQSVTADKRMPSAVYDLQGRKVTNAQHGVYIRNGKKIVK